MNKYLMMVLMMMGLTSCSESGEQYYRNHPRALQQAMKACPGKEPQGFTCEQVEQLGTRINSLAYQLQYSPQGFGQKILKLQETIANQEAAIKTSKAPDLAASLAQNKQDLADFMVVVKWLESPES